MIRVNGRWTWIRSGGSELTGENLRLDDMWSIRVSARGFAERLRSIPNRSGGARVTGQAQAIAPSTHGRFGDLQQVALTVQPRQAPNRQRQDR